MYVSRSITVHVNILHLEKFVGLALDINEVILEEPNVLVFHDPRENGHELLSR